MENPKKHWRRPHQSPWSPAFRMCVRFGAFCKERIASTHSKESFLTLVCNVQFAAVWKCPVENWLLGTCLTKSSIYHDYPTKRTGRRQNDVFSSAKELWLAKRPLAGRFPTLTKSSSLLWSWSTGTAITNRDRFIVVRNILASIVISRLENPTQIGKVVKK